VPLRTLRRLREISGVVLADAQSILRVVGAGGEVRLRAPEAGAVDCIDVLKASRAEAAVLDVAALRKRLTVIVTDGERGCEVLGPDGELHVPAFPAQEIDPTGAGDCFLAGLGLAFLRGVPGGNAALHASWFGARAVEHVGVPRLTREEARGGLEAP
jgi:1D-myo-inositol 3-kinase